MGSELPPERQRLCTGDPDAPDFAWCGKHATYVVQSYENQCQRWSCDDHVGYELNPVMKVEAWWIEFDKWAEEENAKAAVARLENFR